MWTKSVRSQIPSNMHSRSGIESSDTLLWISCEGSHAQCKENDEAYLKWHLAGVQHLCFQCLSVRGQMTKRWKWTSTLKPSSYNSTFLQYEMVKEVGSDFYWCLLFLTSNQNQFILLDRVVYKKAEETQPRGMWNILLRMCFPWYPKHNLFNCLGWCFYFPSFTSFC